jgi:hypothetical protein
MGFDAEGSTGGAGSFDSRAGTRWDGGFCGKRGVVFALDGAPVKGGAAGCGTAGGVSLEVIFEMLGIGLVTAVDQAGGTFDTGAGSS